MIVGATVRYADWGYGTINATDVYRSGVVGVVRYLSNSPDKNLTPAERDNLHAHGLDIRLVWETTETRSLDGANAGTVDGILAATQAKTLGYPAGHVIFASSDTDTTWTAVEPYQRAFGVAVAHYGYRGDIYGGYAVCAGAVNAGYSTTPWQTAAWSYGQTVAEAWAVQNNFHFPIGGVDCDTSDVVHPSTPWRPTPKPKPKPKPPPKHAPKPKPTGGTVSLTPQDLKDIAQLIKAAQDTTIMHIRPAVIAEIDAKFDALSAQVAASKAAG